MGGSSELGDLATVSAGHGTRPDAAAAAATRPRFGPGTVAALLLVTAAVKLALAIAFPGFGTGDDTEVLLSAFRAATGLPYEAWNIRSLFLPELVVAPFLALASFLGVGSTDGLRVAAVLPFVLLSTASLALLHRIALRMTGSRAAALLAASLYAVHWIPLGYASTTFPRTASTTAVLAAFLLLLSRRGSPVPPAAAGACLALAATVRYSEVVFLPAAAAVLLLSDGRAGREKLRGLFALASGFAATGLLTMGLFDAVRTGRPFSSLLAFGSHALLERQYSSLEPVQPSWWYLWRLPKWFPLPLVPLAVLGERKLRAPLAVMLLVPLGLLSLVPHKELRYLQGLIPFVCLLVAAGAAQLFSKGRKRTAVALLAASLPWLSFGITFLARKSTAAVEASRLLAKEPGIGTVALSQSWAYGGNLYFPAVSVRDLPVEPANEDLDAVVPGTDRVCLWADVVERSPGLAERLGEHGFTRAATVRSGTSRPVALFARRPAAARAPAAP